MQARAGKLALEFVSQSADVVVHLHVENANQLLALGIDLYAGGADLLAENRQRVIGQRIDVGDIRIADHDIDEAGAGAHVLRLADGDRHHGRMIGAADLDDAILCIGITGHEQKRRGHRGAQGDRKVAQPIAGASDPVRAPPSEAGCEFVAIASRHTPPPLVDPMPGITGRLHPDPSSTNPHDCLRPARCIPASPPHA